MLTFDQALDIAKQKILMPGVKPEDYLWVRSDFPLRIARMIVAEARHLVTLNQAHYRIINETGAT